MLWSCSHAPSHLWFPDSPPLSSSSSHWASASPFVLNWHTLITYREYCDLQHRRISVMNRELYFTWTFCDSLVSIQCCRLSRHISLESLPAEENVSFKVEWKILMQTFFKSPQRSVWPILMWSAWTGTGTFVEPYFCSQWNMIGSSWWLLSVRKLTGWKLRKNSWMLWHVGVRLFFFRLVWCWFLWL